MERRCASASRTTGRETPNRFARTSSDGSLPAWSNSPRPINSAIRVDKWSPRRGGCASEPQFSQSDSVASLARSCCLTSSGDICSFVRNVERFHEKSNGPRNQVGKLTGFYLLLLHGECTWAIKVRAIRAQAGVAVNKLTRPSPRFGVEAGGLFARAAR